MFEKESPHVSKLLRVGASSSFANMYFASHDPKLFQESRCISVTYNMHGFRNFTFATEAQLLKRLATSSG